jgi:hypothetical protein
MRARKGLLVAGVVSVVAGLVVIFCSWFFFASIGCGDPWPGCTTTVVEWRLTLVGMLLIILGFGIFAYLAYGRIRTSIDGAALFASTTVFLVLFIVITAIVFNPMISPYDFIRDSDGDGYTDDIDDYPHDKRRYMPTVLQVEITWENTSTNYTATIAAVYYILDGWPTDTAIMQLSIIRAPNYFSVMRTEEVGTLSEIEGSWVDGIMYEDEVPLGLLGVNDSFSFDVNEFDIAADVSIRDDMDYMVTWFSVTV